MKPLTRVVVYGGGELGCGIAGRLAFQPGVETHWCAPSIVEGRTGYEDFRLLKGIPPSAKLFNYSTLDAALEGGQPDYLILASSLHEKMPQFEDRAEILSWLFEVAKSQEDLLTTSVLRLSYIPTLITASNPIEAHALRAILKFSYPSEQVLSASGDTLRLTYLIEKDLLQSKKISRKDRRKHVSAFPVGPHHNPLSGVMFCSRNALARF